tara:strand:+ start:952 stop:1653 length:702 start_codon:yes stop_codon:yes gene_type:complete
MGFFSSPKSISPSKVGGYFDQGGHVAKMGDMANALMDPNSEYNAGVLANLRAQASDSLFQKAIVNRRATAASGMTGQSGIINQLQQQDASKTQQGMMDAYSQAMGQNLDRGMGMLGQAAQFDLAKGEAMASAYGQNITNQNNYNSAMAGNIMGGLSSLGSAFIMSDLRVKTDVKKIGKAKAKDGKNINIYSYKYKGSDKPQVGVVAQEIEKSHPGAIGKTSEGIRAVNYKELF